MSSADDKNLDPMFDGIIYLEDHDFTNDHKLKLPGEHKGKPCIVMVFATWCGPCKMTKPHYKKLLDKVDPSKVVVAAVNGSGATTLPSEQKLMKRSKNIFDGFRGFPHICVFDGDGNMVKTHEGKRDVDSMLETLKHVSK